ncbi:unnamed protein product, partial [Symbiodinium necroappetens]
EFRLSCPPTPRPSCAELDASEVDSIQDQVESNRLLALLVHVLAGRILCFGFAGLRATMLAKAPSKRAGGPNADFASVLDSAVVHSEATKDEDGKNATPDPCMKDVDGVKPEIVGAEAVPNNGALASGEQVDIYEFCNIGFLLQYFAVGFLNVPGYVYATAAVVTTMPWSFKLFFGFLNDCFPILGYRRKPYMVIGWTVCFMTLLVLGTRPLPEPYFCVAPDGNFDK